MSFKYYKRYLFGIVHICIETGLHNKKALYYTNVINFSGL